MTAKYQIHLTLWEPANPSIPPLYPPIFINVDTLNKSAYRFFDYLKTEKLLNHIWRCALGTIVMSLINQINSGCLFVPLLTCQDCMHFYNNIFF